MKKYKTVDGDLRCMDELFNSLKGKTYEECRRKVCLISVAALLFVSIKCNNPNARAAARSVLRQIISGEAYFLRMILFPFELKRFLSKTKT